ncbi:hypothetical protein Ciccas_010067 [Cichlidogyrus casuarinus]|uniref:Selenoprotein T n=1 Tax=Cichlidogyrus casuarinus TaxID=1844966 RepID=A0ABD2PY18_9PLAT
MEMSRVVSQRYPFIQIEGEPYPAPKWRTFLASILSWIKLALIIITVVGVDPFSMAGLPTPSFMSYAQENKISFCFMLFIFGNLIEGQLLSTGAFEISLNDVPLWSKLKNHRVPSVNELVSMIEPLLENYPRQRDPAMSTLS